MRISKWEMPFLIAKQATYCAHWVTSNSTTVTILRYVNGRHQIFMLIFLLFVIEVQFCNVIYARFFSSLTPSSVRYWSPFIIMTMLMACTQHFQHDHFKNSWTIHQKVIFFFSTKVSMVISSFCVIERLMKNGKELNQKLNLNYFRFVGFFPRKKFNFLINSYQLKGYFQ